MLDIMRIEDCLQPMFHKIESLRQVNRTFHMCPLLMSIHTCAHTVPETATQAWKGKS